MLYDPDALGPAAAQPVQRLGDRREAPYVYTDEIVLAVNLALATGRPMLVRGPSGVGKSALARDIAGRKGWAFRETQITSRTEAQDLLWAFDALGRLQDAQLGTLRDDAAYVTPGILWHALAPQSAHEQQARTLAAPISAETEAVSDRTVLLIDEIDKADPDFPNNLLTVLGNLSFDVPALGLRVEARQAPMIIVTSNDELDLPEAFVRRCIELSIPPPSRDRLVAIGRRHFPDAPDDFVARLVDKSLSAARQAGSQVSAAEFLDLLEACRALAVDPASPYLEAIMQATIVKPSARKAP